MVERLTAMDIESQEFKRKVRGYDEQEVRLFLRSVADEVERINLDNARHCEEIGELRRRIEEFAQREKSLQDAMIAAQRLSDDLVEKSREEAELVIREARIKSERMLQQAQDQLARIDHEIGQARLERSTFERELRNTVEQHLELLELRRRDRGDRNDNLRVMPRATGDAG